MLRMIVRLVLKMVVRVVLRLVMRIYLRLVVSMVEVVKKVILSCLWVFLPDEWTNEQTNGQSRFCNRKRFKSIT